MPTKDELYNKLLANMTSTHDALQLVVDNLNKGQRQKLLKNEEIKILLDRYEVDYEK